MLRVVVALVLLAASAPLPTASVELQSPPKLPVLWPAQFTVTRKTVMTHTAKMHECLKGKCKWVPTSWKAENDAVLAYDFQNGVFENIQVSPTSRDLALSNNDQTPP